MDNKKETTISCIYYEFLLPMTRLGSSRLTEIFHALISFLKWRKEYLSKFQLAWKVYCNSRVILQTEMVMVNNKQYIRY